VEKGKKTITWKSLSTLLVLALTYFLTGSLVDAGAFSGLHLLISTFMFYIHERVWTKVMQRHHIIIPKHDNYHDAKKDIKKIYGRPNNETGSNRK
jgi:uncharacterized membrane protein